MLTHFEVSNFKSIKHLGLDLKKFMVFVGPNGAGKTNIVRALEVFGEVLHRGTIEPIQEHGYEQLIRREKRPARAGLYFKIRSELPVSIVKDASEAWAKSKIAHASTSGPVHISMSLGVGLGAKDSAHEDEVVIGQEALVLESATSALSLSWNGDRASMEIGTDPILWQLADDSIAYYLAAKQKMSPVKTSPVSEARFLLSRALGLATRDSFDRQLLRIINWQRRPSRTMRYIRDASQIKRLRLDASALRKEVSVDEHKESMLGSTGEGLASAVAKIRGHRAEPSSRFRVILEELQEVYPRIQDVSTRRLPSGHLILLFREHGLSDELGQGSVSDGVLHALALLVALHQGAAGQPGVLAIEEPENALHPWPLRKLIARAQDASRQIMLTTHSETVVNAVTDPGTLFLVENDRKKGTIVAPATERESALKSILEESGQKLGDVWLDGSLGGVPEGER